MRPWLARLSFAAFVLAALTGAIAAVGTRFDVWSPTFGLFHLFPWCICLGLMAFVLGVVWALWAMAANRGEAARYGTIGLVGATFLIAVPLYDAAMGWTSPAIRDISTDVNTPPQFIALQARRQAYARSRPITPADYDGPKLARGPNGKTATAAALQKKYYSDIRTRADLTSPEKLFDRAVKTAHRMGWDVIAVVPEQGRIEATSTSLWFGLSDDIAIRVKGAGVGARLDIRSKSRDDLSAGPFGASDMGRNAAHVRAFLKTLSDTY
ncbi:MAG: DUF1499 domain-containing protein [Alphaproteobacteria bacterium]|nr:DUF1499 domain-containing protein [Alphaproteobacteria bacterium]